MSLVQPINTASTSPYSSYFTPQSPQSYHKPQKTDSLKDRLYTSNASIFNKEPLKPMPLKESAILISGAGGLYGLCTGLKSIIETPAAKRGFIQCALVPPVCTLVGALYFASGIMYILLWNWAVEKHNKGKNRVANPIQNTQYTTPVNQTPSTLISH